jgi:purine-nucleoside phosphorylase
MAKQLLLNRGFENGLVNFYTQGTVSAYGDIAYCGTTSALLLSDPTSIAELSQVVMFLIPGTPVKFSFLARKFYNEDVQGVSNVRAEVNFFSALGTAIPPGMVITIRGRDISKKRWNYYEEYGEVPLGTVAAQVVIRLEPPASGTSGLLVDNLALVAEAVAPPAPQPQIFPSNPVQPGIAGFPVPPVKDFPPAFPGGSMPKTGGCSRSVNINIPNTKNKEK